MWFAILLGVPLAISGVILQEGNFLIWVVSNDWGYKVRAVHRFVSNPFALVLAGMMVTGFLMWIVPKLLSSSAKNKLS